MRRKPEKQLETDHYKITERKGHHNPHRQHRGGFNCPCEEETRGGYAYRDHVAKATDKAAEWEKIRFYHQAPVVRKKSDKYKVDTHGYGTSNTTRERINKELPRGFNLIRRDYEVFLQLPTGDKVEVPEKFIIENGEARKTTGEALTV